ncbi:MAG: hypothetical protein ACRC1D_03400 [Culicoidibacterales bacterium]
MSEIDVNCCPETELTNPKRDFPKKGVKRAHIFRLDNPIPTEVKDTADIQKLFTSWNFIPYAGTSADSGHSLLSWYLMLAKLSPTNAAAIQKKIKYSLGGKAKVVRAVDPEFETGEELLPITTNESKLFIDALKSSAEFEGGVSKFHGRLAWQYKATGNGFVELSVSTVLGQTRCAMRAHKTTNVFFLRTEIGQPKAVAISPVWTDLYLKKNPPRVVPIFPVYTKDKDGVLRTMFQLKNGDNTWYGRPDSEGGDLYKYREVQDAMYQIRAAASDFTGQLIIEVEDDNPEFAPAIDDDNAVRAGESSFVDQFEKNYSNKGDDPQSVLIASRPFGSRPMFVFQVEPNTKQDWYKVTGQISEMHIVRSHQLTPRFMGFDVANGFASEVYLWDYILNVEPVINEFRSEIMDFVNTILTEIWKQTGKEEMNQYSLTFSSPIQSTLEQFKANPTPANQQPNTNRQTNNAPQSDPNLNDPNNNE